MDSTATGLSGEGQSPPAVGVLWTSPRVPRSILSPATPRASGRGIYCRPYSTVMYTKRSVLCVLISLFHAFSSDSQRATPTAQSTRRKRKGSNGAPKLQPDRITEHRRPNVPEVVNPRAAQDRRRRWDTIFIPKRGRLDAWASAASRSRARDVSGVRGAPEQRRRTRRIHGHHFVCMCHAPTPRVAERAYRILQWDRSLVK